jgi:deoxycytidine triphosphate deaminase
MEPLESQVQKLREEFDKLVPRLLKRGAMLSSKEFRELVIKEDLPRMKERFRQRKWSEIPERGFIIEPFDPLNLTPFSYDLSIGNEAFSCRLEKRSSFPVEGNKENPSYWISPGETVIVKTEEYIALPKHFSATVWPRFNFVREGIFQSMVKIDPTWYGQLGVALTNLSPAKYPIWRGKHFATLILYELGEGSDVTLFKTNEELASPIAIEIKEFVSRRKEIEGGLEREGLNEKCKVSTNGSSVTLTVDFALDRAEFDKLREIVKDKAWRENINRNITIKTMDALGLSSIDLLLTNDPEGIRLERAQADLSGSDTEGTSRAAAIKEHQSFEECTEPALTNMAIEKGKPFDIICGFPNYVIRKLEESIQASIDRELGSKVMPRLITLMLSVFTLLSLIAASIGIFSKYLSINTTSIVEALGTSGLILMFLLIVTLLGCHCWKTPHEKISNIGALEKEIGQLSKKLATSVSDLTQKNLDIIGQLQDIKTDLDNVRKAGDQNRHEDSL